MKQKANGEQKYTGDETKTGLLAEQFDLKRKSGWRTRTLKRTVKNKANTRCIQLGWLHFNEHSRRFVAMRLNRGGGTRHNYNTRSASNMFYNLPKVRTNYKIFNIRFKI